MIAGYNALHNMFQRIPTCGFGSVVDLERIRLLFIKMMTSLGKDAKYQKLVESMIQKAGLIGDKVGHAMKSGDTNYGRKCFEEASNELALCIEEVVMVLYNGWTTTASQLQSV